MTSSRRQFLIGAAAFAAKTSLDLLLPSETHSQENGLEEYRKEMFGIEFFGIHKKGLIDYLTPEFYQKNHSRFNEILIKTFQFFEQESLYLENHAQDQWTQDKTQTLNQLIKNLSLDAPALLSSMQTSESIRQKLKQQGFLDFEKNITDYLETKKEVDEKINAIKTLLPKAVEKNKNELELSLAMNNCYSEALQRQIELEKESMFWLRWHHPDYLDQEVDLEKTKEQYQQALDKLKELKASFARHDVNAVINDFVDYRSEFKKANQLFQSNIETLLKQAGTEIAQNMLGQPLVKIEHKNKLYFATKEFAQDWERVQNLIRQKPAKKSEPKKEKKQKPGQIAFSSNHNIYTIDSQGKNLSLLTSGREPKWSPQKNRLAVLKTPKCLAVFEDNKEYSLNFPHLYGFDWSPDGSQIIVASTAPADRRVIELYRINYNGSGLERVTQLNGQTLYPAWSPDGEKIAFAYLEKDKLGPKRLLIADLHGKIIQAQDNANTDLAWLPNGKELSYTQGSKGQKDLVIYNLQSKTTRVISDVFRFTWSPDGEKIAYFDNSQRFHCLHFGSNKNYKLELQMELASGAPQRSLDWAGDEVVFCGKLTGLITKKQVCIINDNAADFKRLTNLEEDCTYLSCKD